MPLHLPNEEVKSRGGVIIRDVVHHSGVGYICNIRTRIIVFYDTDVRASTFLFLIPFVYTCACGVYLLIKLARNLVHEF